MLPVLCGHHSVLCDAKVFLVGSIFDNTNANLTLHQQRLLDWHWDHISMQVCQWIGQTGLLGKLGVKMGKYSA